MTKSFWKTSSMMRPTKKCSEVRTSLCSTKEDVEMGVFINYALMRAKGCLILVPNRSIVISKEKDYAANGEVCCVYGGCDAINVDARVVIATYD